MDTKLLDAIRIILKEELTPTNQRLSSIEARLDSVELEAINLRANMNEGFKQADSRFEKQDDKLDAMLEAWTIQKVHRRELDDHEHRIQAIERRRPVIS